MQFLVSLGNFRKKFMDKTWLSKLKICVQLYFGTLTKRMINNTIQTDVKRDALIHVL